MGETKITKTQIRNIEKRRKRKEEDLVKRKEDLVCVQERVKDLKAHVRVGGVSHGYGTVFDTKGRGVRGWGT